MLPRVIPREQHRISRKQIKPTALRTLYTLRKKGFIAYLVGGCVRDLIMGRSPKDFDIATDAEPGELKKLFGNCRLVGRRFRLAHLYFKDGYLEVSTFRASVPENEREEDLETGSDDPPRHLKNEEGMVLRDNIFGTPEEDALRRDFTVNALAYNIADCSVIDFTNGLSDLERRLIRPIGDPAVRFTEDPVRMLRAVRFAASHDLTIEPSAWETLCELAPIITRSSPARLYEEVQKLFLQGFAAPTFALLERSGLFSALFPALAQRLKANRRLMSRLQTHLEFLDRQHQAGTPPSPALFLTVFFGPVLEEAVFAQHGKGITNRQTLKEMCADFLTAFCTNVKIPGRIIGKVSILIALQPSLLRKPPRRAGRLAANPDFPDALDYLRLSAERGGHHRAALKWWDDFLARASAPAIAESPAAPATKKRSRRRRRRRSRPPVQIAV